MKQLKTVRTDTYYHGEGFFADIVTNSEEECYYAFLFNKEVGIKSFMFSAFFEMTSYEQFVKRVSSSLHDYIEEYEDQFMAEYDEPFNREDDLTVTYDAGNGFCIDITTDDKNRKYSAYVYHKDYGMKDLMKECYQTEMTYDSFVAEIEKKVPEAIENYRSRFLFF